VPRLLRPEEPTEGRMLIADGSLNPSELAT
jgi:hypothetical protein